MCEERSPQPHEGRSLQPHEARSVWIPPAEIKHHILSYIEYVRDIASCMRVCTEWYNIMKLLCEYYNRNFPNTCDTRYMLSLIYKFDPKYHRYKYFHKNAIARLRFMGYKSYKASLSAAKSTLTSKFKDEIYALLSDAMVPIEVIIMAPELRISAGEYNIWYDIDRGDIRYICIMNGSKWDVVMFKDKGRIRYAENSSMENLPERKKLFTDIPEILLRYKF